MKSKVANRRSITKVVPMSGRRRGSRRTLRDPVMTGFTMEREAADRVADMAKSAGTTKSAMAEFLFRQAQVDENGVPLGWAEAHPEATEELPMRRTG